MGKRKLYGKYGSGIVTHTGENVKRVVHRPIPRSDDPAKLAREQRIKFEKNNQEHEDYKTVIKAARNLYLQGYVETKNIIGKLVLDEIIPLYWFERDSAGKVRIIDRRKNQIEYAKIPTEYKNRVKKMKAFIRCSMDEGKDRKEMFNTLNTDEFLLDVHNKNGEYEESKEEFLNNIIAQTILEIKKEIAEQERRMQEQRAKVFDPDDPR